MKQAMIILTIVLMLISCRTYKLSKSDLEWQPYQKGDRLIFESSKGELDTIQIRSIEKYNNADDHLAVFPNSVQSLFVVGNKELLKLHAGKNGSKVEFKLRLGSNSDLKYPGTILYLEKGNLDALEKVEFSAKNSFKIKAEESRGNMESLPFDLQYIYWSKDFGYLGLEFKDNYIWTLISFVRDGKEIL